LRNCDGDWMVVMLWC